QSEQAAENEKRETLIEKASNNAEVDIPDVIIESELDRMVQEFEQRLQMQGLTKEMYFQFSGQDEDALKEQMREDAEKRVKTNLTLEAIAKAEDNEATDHHVNEELENIAYQYNMQVQQHKQMLGENTNANKEDLKHKKTNDYHVDHSQTA